MNGSTRTTPDIGSYEAGTGVNLLPVILTPSSIKFAEDIGTFQVLASDDQTLNFTITGGADQSKLSITTDGKLSFVSIPIFDNPTDVNTDNVYEIEITVSDGVGGITVQSFDVKLVERVYNVLMI